MSKSRLIVLAVILALLNCCQGETTSSEDEGTKIVFYIEHEIDEPDDYVEINIEISSQSGSLEEAINEAKGTVQKVEELVSAYCKAHAKNKKECKEAIEVSDYEIEPIYQQVRKVPTFVAFSVKHEIVAKIQQVAEIGKLTDDILKSGVSKINSFEWKPLQEVDSEEMAVLEGIEHANRICEKVGLKLGRIVNVSEITDYENDEEGAEKEGEEQGGDEEQEGEEEEQEEDDSIIYRFEIRCAEGKSKPTKK